MMLFRCYTAVRHKQNDSATAEHIRLAEQNWVVNQAPKGQDCKKLLTASGKYMQSQVCTLYPLAYNKSVSPNWGLGLNGGPEGY